MPRVSWERIKTLTNVLRFPNIVSNTISMSEQIETHEYVPPADDTNPRIPPPHWTFGRGGYPTFFLLHSVLRALFQFLCLISFGHKNLKPIWAVCYRGCKEEDWEKKRDAIRERLQHVNVVVRLQQSPDEFSAGLDRDFWLHRLLCSLLRRRRFAPRTLL